MTDESAYPSKPVRLILPFAAGGPGNLLATLMGDKLAARWRYPLQIDVRPQDGLETAAKAEPDGYTLVMVAGSYYINPSLYRRLPFDSVRDFAPVSLLASIFNVLVVHPSVPAQSVSELIAYARSKPGELVYASSGYGSAPHLAGELFRILAGVDIAHKPYKGHVAGARALSEGREVHFMFDAMSTALRHIKAGEVRALAVTTAKRALNLPDVPTIAESGLQGFDISPALGLLAPAHTSSEIIRRLSKTISVIMQMPDVAGKVLAGGMQPVGSTSDEFRAYMTDAFARWAKLVRDAHMQVLEAPKI